MKDDTIWERLYRACNRAWVIILPLLLVGVLLDLTVMRGQIPNGLLIGTWVTFLVWVLASHARTERERAEKFRDDATARGLVPIPEKDATLPIGSPLLPGSGPAKNLAHTTVAGLEVFVFEIESMEDDCWYDDEPSRIRFVVCLHQLRGGLPRFHIEVGRGHSRRRSPWARPVVQLPGRASCDPLPSVVETWVREARTTALIAGCGSRSQIRIDGEWMAVLTWDGRGTPWSLMAAATDLVAHIPQHMYRPLGAGLTHLPAPPNGL